ncbi:DNA polymerase III subunit gamma/tau [Candidatus Gracilibacteria bacterium]|nr:DNA polymerase III subunit gamma/tau [Candidatus Gracilibacteria bacterium]MCF7819745.1 DNA polymerase III subunit gamma/tau [Candidatus Gracilibacteria bacterium]
MSALFLKYRPQTFTDVVGQKSVTQTLRNALKNSNPSHAYLFSGSRGTGKTSTARILAKGLNCSEAVDGNPCGKCSFCQDISKGNLIDVIEIDAASNRGIDEIRELREKIKFSPNRALRKVYIIDEVHMLTKEAFNALLKTLEEPPEHAFFILATTEMHKLPETIVSRCQTFIFHRFSLDQLSERLQAICDEEKFRAESEALQLIARKAEGGLRDAISLLEQIASETEGKITAENVRNSLGISSLETLENFWNALQEKNSETALSLLQEIGQSGRDFRTFGHDFLGFLRNNLHQNLTRPEIIADIIPAIENIEKALSQLKTSPIIELPLEIAALRLCQGAEIKKAFSAPPQSIPQKTEPVQNTEPSSKSEKNDSEFLFESEERNEKRTQQKIKQPSSDELLEGEDEIVSVAETKSEAKVFDFSEQVVLEKMIDIAQKAGIPSFAKKSFLTTKPLLQEDKILFQTDSHFHLEKLQKENVRIPIQNSLRELFQQKCLVEFSIAKKQPSEQKASEYATVDDFLDF